MVDFCAYKKGQIYGQISQIFKKNHQIYCQKTQIKMFTSSSPLRALFLGLAFLLVLLCLAESFPSGAVVEEHPADAASDGQVRNKRYYPYEYYGGYPNYYSAPYTRQVTYRRTVYPNWGGEFW